MAAPRWRRRKDERPAEILDAALESFARNGFAATRLDDVAARAGVSKGTLYLYFPSKAELFKGVVRQELLPNLERGEAMVAAHDGDAADLVRKLVVLLGTAVAGTRLGDPEARHRRERQLPGAGALLSEGGHRARLAPDRRDPAARRRAR
jgi:AcrR family transcriptional regulator